MPCDLEVDTDQIRRCAGLLRLAAELLATPADRFGSAAAADRGAAGPAAFREAVRWAATRADHAVGCAVALAGHAGRLSESLHLAAARFDEAEELCSAGW